MKKCKREGCEMEIDEETSRSDKLFCSAKCRAEQHRADTEAELLAAIKKAVNARVRL